MEHSDDWCMLQVIKNYGTMWRLVMVDENKSHGFAPRVFQLILRSNVFHTCVLIVVLLDAIVASRLHFDHRHKLPENKLDQFYYAEVG